jgi:hypothetical protein
MTDQWHVLIAAKEEVAATATAAAAEMRANCTGIFDVMLSPA